MKYFTEPKQNYKPKHGVLYLCDHPVYSLCTLYFDNGRGMAVIQQRYNARTKHTYWTSIDPYLNDILYEAEGFKKYFEEHSSERKDGLYFTVTIRQIMWALRIKPLKRERWETSFDHVDI